MKNMGSLKKNNLNFFKKWSKRKFAVESDWNSQISQNIQNFGFFVKKNKVLSKKSNKR